MRLTKPISRTVGLAAVLALMVVLAAKAAIVVEPVVLNIVPPKLAGSLRLRNNEPASVTVQTRVFKWVQSGGQEKLSPTTDIAASPPVVTLPPGSDYTMRVVRTGAGPLRGEESYRLLVDEVPNLSENRANTVQILLRQSIPVFFRAQNLTPPDVTWSYRIDKTDIEVVATNHGDERLRVASLRLHDNLGREISFGRGLTGYVLGRSVMTFSVHLAVLEFTPADTVALEADTSIGPIRARASRR